MISQSSQDMNRSVDKLCIVEYIKLTYIVEKLKRHQM